MELKDPRVHDSKSVLKLEIAIGNCVVAIESWQGSSNICVCRQQDFKDVSIMPCDLLKM